MRWSPGSCGRKAAGTALLFALALGFLQSVRAQGTLAVTPSSEIHFNARAGQVFELQGSNDLKTWRDTCDVIFGVGDRVSDYLPADGAASNYRFFRVKISPSQEFGFAPKHLPGRKLALNDEGSAQVFSFVSRSRATLGDKQFAYSYQKLSDTTAQLELATAGAVSERIDLDFRADRVGVYTRTRFSAGALADIDRGTFACYNDQSHPSPDPPAAPLPQSLVGLTYLFSDGDQHERLDFVSDGAGRTVHRATVRYFSYDYSRDAETSFLSVNYPGGIGVVYEMRHGGNGCGTLVRRESFDGVADPSSEGIFSSAASVYHSAGAESTATVPADELAGRTYVMRDGGTPCQLKFETRRSGKCTEGNQVDDFQFDYLVSCAVTSRVIIRFGNADYDAYFLNHSDKTFERHEVRGGVERDIDTGTFSESP